MYPEQRLAYWGNPKGQNGRPREPIGSVAEEGKASSNRLRERDSPTGPGDLLFSLAYNGQALPKAAHLAAFGNAVLGHVLSWISKSKA